MQGPACVLKHICGQELSPCCQKACLGSLSTCLSLLCWCVFLILSNLGARVVVIYRSQHEAASLYRSTSRLSPFLLDFISGMVFVCLCACFWGRSKVLPTNIGMLQYVYGGYVTFIHSINFYCTSKNQAEGLGSREWDMMVLYRAWGPWGFQITQSPVMATEPGQAWLPGEHKVLAKAWNGGYRQRREFRVGCGRVGWGVRGWSRRYRRGWWMI